jgi:hypothetical protein
LLCLLLLCQYLKCGSHAQVWEAPSDPIVVVVAPKITTSGISVSLCHRDSHHFDAPPRQYTTTANATIATNNTANSTKQHHHSLYSQSTAPKAFKTTRQSSLRSNTRSLHVEMMQNKIMYNSPANSSTKKM